MAWPEFGYFSSIAIAITAVTAAALPGAWGFGGADRGGRFRTPVRFRLPPAVRRCFVRSRSITRISEYRKEKVEIVEAPAFTLALLPMREGNAPSIQPRPSWAGLVPAIHGASCKISRRLEPPGLLTFARRTKWIAGTSPAVTRRRASRHRQNEEPRTLIPGSYPYGRSERAFNSAAPVMAGLVPPIHGVSAKEDGGLSRLPFEVRCAEPHGWPGQAWP
jgi:hypothetical protein